ncbi:MAG TPA: potassium channel family protein [Tepidisphaeraceae bacterium]|nr:potassium channel family protein [Tepidisphaeraceae bacterium]
MHIVGYFLGAVIILVPLIDGFETIIQPRRVVHRFRLARIYYRCGWLVWRIVARRISHRKVRESFLGIFGPLSLLGLFVVWVFQLILGFSLLQWAARTPLYTIDHAETFLTYLYMSGTTFFTLGYGDVTPLDGFGRTMSVAESGLGFGFLAVLISYLPVLAQSFSRREVTIALLDARAGSPPTAGQILIRLGRSDSLAEVNQFLIEWEAWCAELLESHLSFPVLTYFRSQHDNQSWLAALTAILDTCAVLMSEIAEFNPYRAQLAFAMARHAAVDLSLIFNAPPEHGDADRLTTEKRHDLERALRDAGLQLHQEDAGDKLSELRGMYEPFLHAMARRFMLTLPPLLPEVESADDWQRSPGMRAPGLEKLPMKRPFEHW